MILMAAVALVATACASATGGTTSAPSNTASTTPNDAPATTTATTTAAAVQAPGSLPTGPSALDDRFDSSFPEPLIDPNEVISGGPPPDGIPPIDDPKFVGVDKADTWLEDAEPVLVAQVGDDVRAYPIQILIWHEIVNDTVGGVPLAVTYCPLCNSAITFKRTVRGVETTFGTSGMLYNANLVMYDRATESLWNQLDGRAVIGLLTGEQLERLPANMISWGEFKRTHPDAKVLDKERTGRSRPYGTNPYTGLDNPDGAPFLFIGDVDTRAKAMQRIVAIENENTAVAWTLDVLAGDGSVPTVTTGEFDGQPLVIFWEPGQNSALETDSVAVGRDVGNVGVFSPVVDGQTLSFHVEGDRFVDDATGTTWDIFGQAVNGPMAGTALEPITFVRTFWFSWAAFRPDTDLIDS